MSPRARLALLLVAAAAALSACGGGDEPASTPKDPLPGGSQFGEGVRTPGERPSTADDPVGTGTRNEASRPGATASPRESASRPRRSGAKRRRAGARSRSVRERDRSRGEGAPGGGSDRPAPGVRSEAEGTLTAAEERDVETIKERLHELIRRSNARDPDLCTDLFTQRHVEEVTGLRGAAAVQKCRVDISTSKATLRLDEIHGGKLLGDRGLIQFTASVGSRTQRQTLRVRKDAGIWRFDGDGSKDL
jgi:hypothetical protein